MSKKKRYPIRVPHAASGIRSQSVRAATGRSWWQQRWQDAIGRMNVDGRLGRGRNYALSGQVLSLTLAGSHVEARVAGLRPKPYRVTIDFRAPVGAVRERIVAALRAQPMLVARLLADEMPLEVAEIFRREGADLFPGGKLGPGRYDVTTACSCPDYANPCKHADAVLILLGEEIACRPATLLALRGFSLEEFYED